MRAVGQSRGILTERRLGMGVSLSSGALEELLKRSSGSSSTPKAAGPYSCETALST